MQKIINTLGKYELSSVHEEKFDKGITSARCIDADKQIANKIAELEKRVSELKELQEFMQTNSQAYYFEGNSSNFSYTDKFGNPYEYKEAYNKHILIDKDFNVYEIIGYENVKDVTFKSNHVIQICKIVKLIPLGK